MMKQAVFYHAGCPVCMTAERGLVQALDPSQYSVRIVHLGESRDEIITAERAGVKSVPALVLDGQVYHINHGADLSALRS